MGTPWFLVGMSVVVVVWLAYNTLAPEAAQFDPRLHELHAAHAHPVAAGVVRGASSILLAQNRQDDRDRVQIEQDRQRAERNLNDTEYLAREVVALRLAMRDLASKDFIRAELRSLLEELDGEEERGQEGREEG